MKGKGLGFAALVLAHITVDAYSGIIGAYGPLRGLDPATLGTLATTYVTFAALGQVAFGLWGDRLGWRPCYLFGVFASAVFSALAISPWAPLWAVFVFFCIAGLGNAAFHPTAVSAAGALDPRRSTILVSVLLGGGTLGLSFSQPVLTRFWTAYQDSPWMYAVPGLAMGVVLLLLKSPAGPAERRDLPPVMPALRASRGPVALLVTLMALRACICMVLSSFVPTLMGTAGRGSHPVETGAWLVGATMFCGAMMMPVIGHWADRRGGGTVLTATSLVLLPALAVFLLGPDLPLWAQGFALIVAGTMGICTNAAHVTIGHALLPRHKAFVSSLVMGLAWAIAGIGPMVVGRMGGVLDGGLDASMSMLLVPAVLLVLLTRRLARHPEVAAARGASATDAPVI